MDTSPPPEWAMGTPMRIGPSAPATSNGRSWHATDTCTSSVRTLQPSDTASCSVYTPGAWGVNTVVRRAVDVEPAIGARDAGAARGGDATTVQR